MAAYNDAMISGFISKNYPGLPTDPGYISRVMNASQGGDPNFLDQAIKSSPEYQTQQQTQAQQQYQQGISSAISNFKTRQADLPQQYSDLLKTIKEQQGIETQFAEGAANTSLAQRGIDPNSVYGQQQLGSSLLPITSQFLGQETQAQQGSISDTQSLASAIASLQAGGAGTSSQLPLQYGQLALQTQALPSQIALTQANTQQALTGARFITIPNVGVYDIQSKSFVGGGIGASPSALTGVGGLFRQTP